MLAPQSTIQVDACY
jgi:hypothetical protein